MLDEWLQPIEGPAAWRGAELARDPSWRRLRIWLSAPFTRPLPQGHAVQWGDTRACAAARSRARARLPPERQGNVSV